MESNLTINSTLISTPHDRQRRQERKIGKSELQRARRYGMVEEGRGNGVKKYYHDGNVFVYDEQRNQAITSWKITTFKRKCGTSAVNPTILCKSKEHDNAQAVKAHNRLRHCLVSQKHLWKSHSVLVIDMSGSMRFDDVNGARCRSDGVWMVLARDFVKKQLEEGTASVFDFVSIVLMGDTAKVFSFYEPIDWVLYNKLVELREWTTVKPSGAGNYLPALEQAQKLLNYNSCGSCSLSLLFFSDGKPSDRDNQLKCVIPMMGEIASRFGRRLVVSCIGMANNENFSIMEKMAKEACDFGCKSSFNKPALNIDSLSSSIVTLTTSMTSTKTELTELRTGKMRSVRTDVVRERKGAPDDKAPNANWRIFPPRSPDMYVSMVCTWNSVADDFARVIDRRCFYCYIEVADESYGISPEKGELCNFCKACYFCSDCVAKGMGFETEHDCSIRAHDRRICMLLKRSIPSFGVAYKKDAFGEGAERLAFKFRFIDEDGNFVGSRMVAKESRFVEPDEGCADSELLAKNRYIYHRQFMRTQTIAARFAQIYNRHLDDYLPTIVTSKRFGLRLKRYPRIHFLDPLVFCLESEEEGEDEVKKSYILVEPMIEGTYRKFNNNFGAVANEIIAPLANAKTDLSLDVEESLINFLLGRNNEGKSKIDKGEKPISEAKHLVAIVEEEDEEEVGDDWDDESAVSDGHVDAKRIIHDVNSNFAKKDGGINQIFDGSAELAPPIHSYDDIPDDDFAQAFSHFSYVRSGGNVMVVDLQGTLNVNPDGTRHFIFTDPAIHKRRKKEVNKFYGRLNFGRTDRGRAGMLAFFYTHVCNDACRLLGLRPRQQSKAVEED